MDTLYHMARVNGLEKGELQQIENLRDNLNIRLKQHILDGEAKSDGGRFIKIIANLTWALLNDFHRSFASKEDHALYLNEAVAALKRAGATYKDLAIFDTAEERQQRISREIKEARTQQDFEMIAQVWSYDLSQPEAQLPRKQLVESGHMCEVIQYLQVNTEWQTIIDGDNLSAVERIAKYLKLDAIEDPDLQPWIEKHADLLNREVKADSVFHRRVTTDKGRIGQSLLNALLATYWKVADEGGKADQAFTRAKEQMMDLAIADDDKRRMDRIIEELDHISTEEQIHHFADRWSDELVRNDVMGKELRIRLVKSGY